MNSGRPKEFDPADALDAAMHVFWTKGYEAASLQDLIEAMKLSKSSFYQTFESKHALFQDCIDHYGRGILHQMTLGLQNAGTAREFLEKMFLSIAHEARGKQKFGCLIMNTASEIGQSDKRISKIIRQNVEILEQTLADAILQGHADGSIDPKKDPISLARYLVTNISGLKNMVKAGMSSEQLEETVKFVMSAV